MTERYDAYGDQIFPGQPGYSSCGEVLVPAVDPAHVIRESMIRRHPSCLVWSKEMVDGLAHWSAPSVIMDGDRRLMWKLVPQVEHGTLSWAPRHDAVLQAAMDADPYIGLYSNLWQHKSACGDVESLIRAGLQGESHPAIRVKVK